MDKETQEMIDKLKKVSYMVASLGIRDPCPHARTCSRYPRFFGDKEPINVESEVTEDYTSYFYTCRYGGRKCSFLNEKYPEPVYETNKK